MVTKAAFVPVFLITKETGGLVSARCSTTRVFGNGQCLWLIDRGAALTLDLRRRRCRREPVRRMHDLACTPPAVAAPAGTAATAPPAKAIPPAATSATRFIRSAHFVTSLWSHSAQPREERFLGVHENTSDSRQMPAGVQLFGIGQTRPRATAVRHLPSWAPRPHGGAHHAWRECRSCRRVDGSSRVLITFGGPRSSMSDAADSGRYSACCSSTQAVAIGRLRSSGTPALPSGLRQLAREPVAWRRGRPARHGKDGTRAVRRSRAGCVSNVAAFGRARRCVTGSTKPIQRGYS